MAEHKLKMVKNKQGQSVPFFAADGKGKMKRGGAVKKKIKKKVELGINLLGLIFHFYYPK